MFGPARGWGVGVVSDIFISYAREDRAVAAALANDLKARGYSVWWDTELVGSDDFQDVILTALSKARAAIVIWTKASVKSLFVRDEARYALHHRKLVAVKHPSVDVLELPFGFQSQHTDDVHDRNQIVRAITKLGVVCTSLASSSLDTREAPAAMEEALRRAVHTSHLSAFMSGLTFQTPSFQLSAQGKWSAIGQAIGLVILVIFGVFVAGYITTAVGAALKISGFSDNRAQLISNILLAVSMVLFIGFALRRFSLFVAQRHFTGTLILAPVIVLLAFVLAIVATAID
jgi:hypothetical protein